ncbi:hypothetical protein WA577_001650 [Blastocystis sp. JDR]
MSLLLRTLKPLCSSISFCPQWVLCRYAHNQSGGKTSNGRDSNPKYLGVKKYGCQKVIPGNIIVRQRGTKYHAGEGVGTGRDYTLYALTEGYVHFTWNPFTKKQTISITDKPLPSTKITDPKSVPKRIYG